MKSYFELGELHLNESSSIPLHRQLSDLVKDRLTRNYVQEGMLVPSISELSREHRLNRETVRKAYHTLEEEQILERDSFGRSLYISRHFLERKSRIPVTTIGLVLPDTMLSIMDSESQLPMLMVSGIVDCAFTDGIAVMVLPLPADGQDKSHFETWCRDVLPTLGGLIYLGEDCKVSHSQALRTLLAQRTLPQVFIGGKAFEDHLGTVELDQETAISSLVTAFREAGHRKLAIFGGTVPARAMFQLQTIDRLPLFRNAIRQFFSLPERLVFSGDYHSADARNWLVSLLKSPDGPTGILCTGAFEARMVMKTAAELGLSVPGDLSVSGYDLAPSEGIATLRYPYVQMGKSALEIIMESRTRNLPVSKLRRVLPVSVYLHGTIGPCKYK